MKIRRVLFITLLVALLATTLVLGARVLLAPPLAGRNTDWQSYFDVLNKKEQEQWQKRRQQDYVVYLQVNQQIEYHPQTKEAALRLINPPYNAYAMQAEIRESDDGTILYRSARLSPGTVVETAPFETDYEPGQGKAEVRFRFYDGRGKFLKEEVLTVTISRTT